MPGSEENERREFFYLPHDADILVRLKSPTFEGLLAAGMKALFSTILVDYPGAYSGKVEKEISFSADTREDLLVEWLRKLLIEFSVNSSVPANVVFKKGDGLAYKAFVSFGEYEPGINKLNTEIKAITYHNLKIWNDRGLAWYATVLFDV